jgi:hypothetical protein
VSHELAQPLCCSSCEHFRRGGASPGTLFAGWFTAELQAQMAEYNRMTISGPSSHLRASSRIIPQLTVSLVRIPLAPPACPKSCILRAIPLAIEPSSRSQF